MLPTKVVAIGKNYADHAREMGGEPPDEPVIFLKPSTSVIGPGDPVARPVKLSERVDFEGELAVVIGRLCRDVPPERVSEVIFGYTCANDVTARDLQAKDGQWTRAKGFDTFCPLGPWIETGLDPSDLELTTTVNGEVKQHARTSQLLHDVTAVVCYVTSVMTLLPGDILLTRTRPGSAHWCKRPCVYHPGCQRADQPVVDRMTEPVAGSAAPRPSGQPRRPAATHVGNIRTALRLGVRPAPAAFVLRIEDTDQSRVPGYIASALDTLRWLGP